MLYSISALAAAPVVSSAATAIHPWASPAAAGAGCWLPSPVARAPVLPAWPASPQHLPQHPLPQQHQPPQPPPPPPPRLLAWDSPPPPAAVMKIEDLSAAAPGSVQHPHLSSPVQRVMASDPGMVQSQQSDSAPTILTVRMIMQGKEVGSIIGKKGDNIKKFREESGAKINISDGSCPERVVTITGTTDAIYKAFTLICNKFEEVTIPVLQEMGNSSPTVPKPPVTLRLVVPASQCGSLIGKGGCKIKEIRESTGASIQVASEMLPNSTERAVTVSGTAEAITECIRHVCTIMLESPPKGANIPYRPKPVVSPVIFAGGQAYSLPPGQMGMPAPEQMAKMPHGMPMPHPVPTIIPSPQTLLPGGGVPVNGFTAMHFPRPANPNVPAGQQSHEITIPNDLIGCIIGRGGQKINEIRQLSGANIKIANAEEGSSDRKVTITGAPDMIALAQYLINTRISTEVCGIGIR